MSAPSLPPAWQLYLKDHRISTFKNWPFLEGCACTPERVRLRGLREPPGPPRPQSSAPGPEATPPAGSGLSGAPGSQGRPLPRAPVSPWAPEPQGRVGGGERLPPRGLSGAVPRRWPLPVSSTVPLRTSPIWLNVSSASKSWKAGSQTTTPCKCPRPASLGFWVAPWGPFVLSWAPPRTREF